MTGGKREIGGEREGVEVITFTLDGCHACTELKERLRNEGISFRNLSVDENEKLGDALEREYLTEFYPIVQIVNKYSKTPYYTFVTESQLKGFKIINWDSIPELVTKLKNKLYEI